MSNVQYPFTEKLMMWFEAHQRDLPWKTNRNPYHIWLSEIILQQTTVQQGTPYFQKFVAAYPSVSDLAAAPDDEVMKHWEGLGYYARCRNLLATARFVATDLGGIFPNTYEGLLALKGVGAYTAAAIASFAYDLPYPVVDGNVFRVLSRVFGIETAIDAADARRIFTDLANTQLPTDRAADFNQAIMDFGATWCTPAKPRCTDCPMRDICVALKTDKVGLLPIKNKKLVKKTRYFNYFLFNFGDEIAVRKRAEKDIWQDLFEFPLLETEKLADTEGGDIKIFLTENLGENFTIKQKSPVFKQQLTHQTIFATFWEIDIFNISSKKMFLDQEKKSNFLLVHKKEISKFAFPKVIDAYLKNKILTLF